MCVCLAEALLRFSAANLNARFISLGSSASRLSCISVSVLFARSGWLVHRQLLGCLAMVWAPSASWGLCWCLLADALQRDCELISSDYHSAAQFSCRILVLFLFFLLPDLDDLDVGGKSVKSGI